MAKRKQRIGSDPLDDIPSRVSRTRAPSTADRKRSAAPKASTAAPRTPTSPAPSTAQPRRPKASTPDDWDNSHERVTFYCPTTLLDQVKKKMARDGLSKTRVIVEALESALKAR